MNTEWRCTFPAKYGPNTPGHEHAGSRQGYYVDAGDVYEAAQRAAERAEAKLPVSVDVQSWNPRDLTVTRVRVVPEKKAEKGKK